MPVRFPSRTHRDATVRAVIRTQHHADPLLQAVPVLPVPVYHDRIEHHHMAVAARAHDAVSAACARPETPLESGQMGREATQLQCMLDLIAEHLTSATRAFEQLLASLPAEVRRRDLQAIAMLARAHDDCCQELAEAGDAQRTGTSVHVRIRLARLFAAVERAEQAHKYLRSRPLPAA